MYMTKFKRDSSQKYTLITSDTSLHELEDFLKNNDFALGSLLLTIIRSMPNSAQ